MQPHLKAFEITLTLLTLTIMHKMSIKRLLCINLMPGVSGHGLKEEICHNLRPSERYFQELGSNSRYIFRFDARTTSACIASTNPVTL